MGQAAPRARPKSEQEAPTSSRTMDQDNGPHSSTADRRGPSRQPLSGRVVIELERVQLVGPGQNISSDGVYFVSDGNIPVRVHLEGRDGEITGELVRVEAMGQGKLGVAVRFRESGRA
jgi:hypothetical protein